MYDFDNRTLVLTGAAGGIGKAIAKVFVDCGANVLLADINESTAATHASALDPSDSKAVAVRYNASSPSDAQSLVDLALDRFGRIDFLVTAAALYEPASIMTMTDETWRAAMSINLDGVSTSSAGQCQK